jgi:general secretion pathway protein F
MPPPYPPLKFRVRADLFSQLAAMEKAGFPFDKALATLRLPQDAQPRLAAMRRFIAAKLDVPDAGLRSGVFTALEASLLRAAFSAGSPERTYRRLSDYYARRAAHAAAMKSRMALPVALLVIAAFVQPLPSLVAGSFGAGGYLLRCLLPLVALGAIAYVIVELPNWSQRGSQRPVGDAIDRLLLRAPLFGTVNARRNVRDFFESLALLLDAGMPMLDALPKAVDTMQNPIVRNTFAQIGPRIERGARFAEAIRELPFEGRAQACALILSGEASGALPEVLFRYAESETDSINRFDELVAEWVPRLVYTLVAVWIAYGIIHGVGVGPSLPEELR